MRLLVVEAERMIVEGPRTALRLQACATPQSGRC
jgi:hypothetical protein